MDIETSITKIKEKIAEIKNFDRSERFCPEFKKWYREVVVLLRRIFGKDSYQLADFTIIDFVYRGGHRAGDQQPFERRYRSALKESEAILISIHEEIEEFGIDNESEENTNPLVTLEHLLNRFHAVARQLRRRYSNRETLDISDEYDVQDLLHSLLKIFFKDVRPEEWTPSYGGNCSRMDFLLHNEEIVVETKMTRKKLTDREIVDELLIDITRYQEHPKCKTLVCFVYDPDGYIRNPVAVSNDLEKQAMNIGLKVFIKPNNN